MHKDIQYSTYQFNWLFTLSKSCNKYFYSNSEWVLEKMKIVVSEAKLTYKVRNNVRQFTASRLKKREVMDNFETAGWWFTQKTKIQFPIIQMYLYQRTCMAETSKQKSTAK